MKKYFSPFRLCIILALCVFSSCDDDFEEINRSKDLVTEPNLDLMLTPLQLNMLERQYYTAGSIVAPWVGQVTPGSTFEGLNEIGSFEHGYHFEWIYQNPMKNVVDLIDRSKGNPEQVNYHNIGRIIKAYLVHQLTDAYGDIPYFEAGKGYSEQIYTPKYDPQQAIYNDLFKELSEAAQALDNAKPVPTQADIVYKGDLNKWKKFANGLILRLGLRILDVDPEGGKRWINHAIAGGLPENNADNFVVFYMPSSYYGVTQNGHPHIFIRYYNGSRLTAPFIDFLKNHNDPRTSVYAMLPGSTSSYKNGDKTLSKQKGYPMFGNVPEPKSNFSVANKETFGKYDAPFIHLSYAQVQFQLAELVVREVISGDDKAYYENGVRAAMDALKVYGPEGVIAPDKANAYLLENPYTPASKEAALEMINSQYWVEAHFNWYEIFANMRRSGYPKIYETYGQGYTLPKRLTYPSAEVSINPNVQQAVQHQGPDVITTPVWWDKN